MSRNTENYPNHLLNDSSNPRNPELIGSKISSQNEPVSSMRSYGIEWTQKKPQDSRAKNKGGLRGFNVTSGPLRIRPKSAPSRPLTEVEAFRRSREFVQLECAALSMWNEIWYAGRPLYYLEILDLAQERLPFIIVNSEKYFFSTNILISGDKLFSAFTPHSKGQGRPQRYLLHVTSVPANRICDDLAEVEVKKAISLLRGRLQEFDFRWASFEKVNSSNVV
eukprot:TRINITY_DN2800_c0_g1_i7.p1 TRINITY_DN2800_c0_g1~~TRINITY_DN2800_c0_g1_i7.p1  ORF type:complete len:222 (+),score=26.75 TRINITY_DN2800_c0_g1_i7:265-930(+)